jgi:hypothetical protein
LVGNERGGPRECDKEKQTGASASINGKARIAAPIKAFSDSHLYYPGFGTIPRLACTGGSSGGALFITPPEKHHNPIRSLLVSFRLTRRSLSSLRPQVNLSQVLVNNLPLIAVS